MAKRKIFGLLELYGPEGLLVREELTSSRRTDEVSYLFDMNKVHYEDDNLMQYQRQIGKNYSLLWSIL